MLEILILDEVDLTVIQNFSGQVYFMLLQRTTFGYNWQAQGGHAPCACL